jgi:ABC-type sugar transport system permease subunit
MTASLRIGFSFALVALFAWSLFQAQAFRSQARLFPLVIGIVGVALALLQTGLEVRRRGALSPSSPSEDEDEIPAELRRRRTISILAWTAGFTLVVWLLGFTLAVPLATLAFVRFAGRESWLTSVIFAAVSGATFWALFVYAVRVPFDDGALFSLWPG